RVLVGAHIDTVRGSPGADDNASGVAGVLECARLLATTATTATTATNATDATGRAGPTGAAGTAAERGSENRFRATVELAFFDLEEQQLFTYRVGSRRYTERARKERVEYAGALIFEMIGYTSTEPDSQRIPLLVRWKDIPRTGDFLAVVGDWKSGSLIEGFEEAAREAAPELDVYTHRTPFRGWLVWQTRLSDNASFWSDGYPALMITDTAFLRNPNYHAPGDTAATLDYDFTAGVVDATAELVKRLAG
ncbi:MAG: M28 family peptidase, partial [Gemmatimonadota bacterium]